MIQLKKLSFSYPEMPMYFDLHIKAGEKIAVVGTSGSGKSTLLNLIAGFCFANSGEVWLDNRNHTRSQPYQRPVSMLFQDNNLFNHLNVMQNIGLGIAPNLKLSEEQYQAVGNIAAQVGLADYLKRYPDKLSGGQKQRVALARCMIRNQPILLLDEPFSALDASLRLEMIELLETICQEKQLTLLMVTHQPEEIEHLIDRVISVDNGCFIEKYNKPVK
ncbi:MAG: thiamine ABC transporter ATP-binding protein [Gammaproteobacteria bacterium]|nr:MAG: thiamine ABC transporter ATP-binding protein [Gammaproteobacteria bacterium]